jgi:hypothetical protein
MLAPALVIVPQRLDPEVDPKFCEIAKKADIEHFPSLPRGPRDIEIQRSACGT